MVATTTVGGDGSTVPLASRLTATAATHRPLIDTTSRITTSNDQHLRDDTTSIPTEQPQSIEPPRPTVVALTSDADATASRRTDSTETPL